MEKKYNFVYITTNLINGKQYVGEHSTDDLNCYSTIKYLGGGKPIFENAVKKYGRENFKREILEFFPTKQEAFDCQEKYINKYNTLIPNGYNISPKGGYGKKDSILNNETKKKIKESNAGKHSGKNSNFYNKPFKKGKTHKQQMIEIYGEVDGVIKAKQYDEQISRSVTGINNPMYKKGYLLLGEKNGMFGKVSPMRGKKYPKDFGKKISAAKTGVKRKTTTCIYCNRTMSVSAHTRYHGEKCKCK